MKRYTLHALVVVNVLLAGVLGWLWVHPDGQLRNATWTPPAAIKPDFSASPRASSRPPRIDMSLVVATLDRPLFSPNRRPPPPAVAAGAAPEAPPDPLANVLIQGLYAGAGTGGIIASVDGVSKRISINEKIGDWTLKSIEERDVKFVRNDESRVVQLLRARPTAPQATASARPTGGARPAAVATGRITAQTMEDANRERLRRRNEARAKAGLPPVALP